MGLLLVMQPSAIRPGLHEIHSALAPRLPPAKWPQVGALPLLQPLSQGCARIAHVSTVVSLDDEATECKHVPHHHHKALYW